MVANNDDEQFAEASDGENADAVVATGARQDEVDAVAASVSAEVGSELELDIIFELLSNERRREAIIYLETNDGRATLSELAEHIAANENHIPIEAITSRQRKRVYIGLYQRHLPKLASAGVVDHDRDRGTVQLMDLAAQLDPYLLTEETAGGASLVGGYSLSLRRSTVGLGAAGFSSVAGAVGAPPFDFLSPVIWALFAGFSLLSTAAVWSLRP